MILKNWKLQIGLILVLLPGLGTAVTASMEAETLLYQAYYQGVFSAGEPIGIADIQLQTRLMDFDEGAGAAIETHLQVSSAAHGLVEELYPFRLQYRSLAMQKPMRTIAYEKYDSTDNDGWELTWLDTGSRSALRFRQGNEQQPGVKAQLPTALVSWGSQRGEYRFYKPARHPAVPRMLDRVALLQKVRGNDLTVGKRFEITVTDGKRQYLYQVSVLGAEQLTIGTKTWDALKIKFDGYRTKRGVTGRAHEPVEVWLADTPQRTPLRFEHQSAIGRFVIELSAPNRS